VLGQPSPSIDKEPGTLRRLINRSHRQWCGKALGLQILVCIDKAASHFQFHFKIITQRQKEFLVESVNMLVMKH
jgi:hypothetical protein